MLYYRIDSIMLKSLSDNRSVGLYNAAYRLMEVALLLSQLFGLSLLPVLSSAQKDPEAFARLARRSFKALAFLAFPVAVGGTLLAGPLVTLFFGEEYRSAGPVFARLCLSVIPFYLANVYMNVLTIRGPKRLVLLFASLLALNVALNFILIPRSGPVGAATATVLSEGVGLLAGFWIIRRYLRTRRSVPLAWPVTASLAASALMGVCIARDPRLYWLIAGPVVYFAALVLLRALGSEDWDSLRSVLRRRTS